MKTKIIQILIVIILIIMSYMVGQLSMQKDLYELSGRIYELEIEINHLMGTQEN